MHKHQLIKPIKSTGIRISSINLFSRVTQRNGPSPLSIEIGLSFDFGRASGFLDE